jgi:hypothetical protein
MRRHCVYEAGRVRQTPLLASSSCAHFYSQVTALRPQSHLLVLVTTLHPSVDYAVQTTSHLQAILGL